MKLSYLAPVLLLSIPLEVIAEDVLKAPARVPSYRLDYNVASEVGFDDVDGGFSYSRLSLDAPLSPPIYLTSDSFLLIGSRYRKTELDTDTVIGDVGLHDFRLNLRWIYKEPSSKWAWTAALTPGIATDGDSVGSDSFFLNGQLGFSYKKSDRFTWLGGLVFFTNPYENRVFPGIGFRWRPSDEAQLDFTGPIIMGSWQPSDDWIYRFDARPAGGFWNIEKDGEEINLDLDSYQVGVGVERRLTKKFWLGFTGGVAFANGLEAETSSGAEIFREDAEAGWFTQLGIRMTLW